MDINRPYSVSWPTSLKKLAEKLNTNRFADASEEGFILDKAQDNYIDGRFIQRIQKIRTVRDPLGNEFETEQLEFRQTRFICHAGVISLQILNPAVGWKRFFTVLTSTLEKPLVVNSAKLDLHVWHEILSIEPGVFQHPISLQTTPVEIGYGASAKIKISGTRNVINACADFLTDFPHKLQSIEYRFKDLQSVRVIISEDGSYQISQSAEVELRDYLHRTRLKALDSANK